MPLIAVDPQTGFATHICQGCGAERQLKPKDFIIPSPADSSGPADESVFGSPPCPCGTTETFNYTSWVQSRFVPRRTLVDVAYTDEHGKRQVRQAWKNLKPELEADPTLWDAEHMVLIEAVAKKLNRKRRDRSDHPEQQGLAYDKPPKAPHPNRARNRTAVAMMKRGRKVLPDFLP
jgi:hypothetical protein